MKKLITILILALMVVPVVSAVTYHRYIIYDPDLPYNTFLVNTDSIYDLFNFWKTIEHSKFSYEEGRVLHELEPRIEGYSCDSVGMCKLACFYELNDEDSYPSRESQGNAGAVTRNLNQCFEICNDWYDDLAEEMGKVEACYSDPNWDSVDYNSVRVFRYYFEDNWIFGYGKYRVYSPPPIEEYVEKEEFTYLNTHYCVESPTNISMEWYPKDQPMQKAYPLKEPDKLCFNTKVLIKYLSEELTNG